MLDVKGTDMSVDVFRQELLSGLDVSELDSFWTEASLLQLGLAPRSTHSESAKHQLLRLIDALAASVENLPDLHPRLFEYVVAALLAASGYQSVRVTGPSADGGIDILASRNVGLGRSLFLVQCKRYAPHRKVGRPAVQLTYGVLAEYGATKAALVTISAFTRPASDFLAKNDNQIAGLDGQDLETWLQATAQIARQPLVPDRLVGGDLPR
jgi:restriction endonuclease Mrr